MQLWLPALSKDFELTTLRFEFSIFYFYHLASLSFSDSHYYIRWPVHNLQHIVSMVMGGLKSLVNCHCWIARSLHRWKEVWEMFLSIHLGPTNLQAGCCDVTGGTWAIWHANSLDTNIDNEQGNLILNMIREHGVVVVLYPDYFLLSLVPRSRPHFDGRCEKCSQGRRPVVA